MLHCLWKCSHGILAMLPWKSQKSEGANAFRERPQICQMEKCEPQASRTSSQIGNLKRADRSLD